MEKETCSPRSNMTIWALASSLRTRAAAEAAGMKTAMAEKATIDSVVDLVIKLKESR